jgi:hypothetical protein
LRVLNITVVAEQISFGFRPTPFFAKVSRYNVFLAHPEAGTPKAQGFLDKRQVDIDLPVRGQRFSIRGDVLISGFRGVPGVADRPLTNAAQAAPRLSG